MIMDTQVDDDLNANCIKLVIEEEHGSNASRLPIEVS